MRAREGGGAARAVAPDEQLLGRAAAEVRHVGWAHRLPLLERGESLVPHPRGVSGEEFAELRRRAEAAGLKLSERVDAPRAVLV